jgi:hypothetical protein
MNVAANQSNLKVSPDAGNVVSGYTCEVLHYVSYPQLTGEYLAVRKVNTACYLEAIFVSVKDGAAGKMWSTSGLPNKEHAPVMLNPVTVQKKLANESWLVIKHEVPVLLRYIKDNFWRVENVDALLTKLDEVSKNLGHSAGEAGTLSLTLRSLPDVPVVAAGKPFDPFEL